MGNCTYLIFLHVYYIPTHIIFVYHYIFRQSRYSRVFSVSLLNQYEVIMTEKIKQLQLGRMVTSDSQAEMNSSFLFHVSNGEETFAQTSTFHKRKIQLGQ